MIICLYYFLKYWYL